MVRRVPRAARLKVATAGIGVATVLVLVIAGLSSRVPSVQEATLAVSQEYRVTPTSVVLNQDEMNVINEIPKIVPKGDVIVNNPWDGSAYIYALADRHLTGYHFEFETSPKYSAIYAQPQGRSYKSGGVPRSEQVQGPLVRSPGEPVELRPRRTEKLRRPRSCYRHGRADPGVLLGSDDSVPH